MVWCWLLIAAHTQQKPLHIAIFAQVPQEEKTFLAFSEWGGEGEDGSGEEGVNLGEQEPSLSPVLHLMLCLPDCLYPDSLTQSFSH